MVDSISSIGAGQNVEVSKRDTQQRAEQSERKDKATGPKDEVLISDEALQLSEQRASQEAVEAREALKSRQEETLGLDPSFDQSV